MGQNKCVSMGERRSRENGFFCLQPHVHLGTRSTHKTMTATTMIPKITPRLSIVQGRKLSTKVSGCCPFFRFGSVCDTKSPVRIMLKGQCKAYRAQMHLHMVHLGLILEPDRTRHPSVLQAMEVPQIRTLVARALLWNREVPKLCIK